MNEIIVPETHISEKEITAGVKNATQVIGEVVVIAGALYLVHRGYRALIRRAVRKELKKNEK
jgi:threonine/homoserine/homoserine lactone efflux protein